MQKKNKIEDEELKKIRSELLERQIQVLLEQNKQISIKISDLEREYLLLTNKHPLVMSDKVFPREFREKYCES